MRSLPIRPLLLALCVILSPVAIPEPTLATPTASQYRQQGLSLREQSRYAEAIAALQKAVELDPKNLSGRVLLGWTLHLNGQREAATEALLAALKQDPNDVPALNALGIVYLVKGDLGWAVITHNLARLLKPNNEIAYYNLSLAYHRLQLYDWAIRDAQTAAQLEPYNPHPLVAIAIAAWDKGDRSAAQQAYRRALGLDGQYADATYLDHLERAGFSVDQIQVSRSILQSLR